MAVMLILLAAAVKVVASTGPQSRRAASDVLTGMIEQARSTAITRCPVFLAIAEPGDRISSDRHTRIGLFLIPTWTAGAAVQDAVPLRRWEALPPGVVLIPEPVDGQRNPLDLPEITLRYQQAGLSTTGHFHGVAFTSRGGVSWPPGIEPIVMRVAQGSYRNGRSVADGNGHAIPEDCLTIGRMVARSYRSN
jgi:hypothetical protein